MSAVADPSIQHPVDNVRELHDRLRERRRELRRVEREIDDVAGHLNAQHGRLIDITVWLLAHPEEWCGDGVWKPQQFLAWRCGISRGVADKVVALAERAGELPETLAAVRSGELSLDQAAPIAQRVPGWAEQRVVSLAKRLTVRQIQRTVAQYDFTLEAAATESGEHDEAIADRRDEAIDDEVTDGTVDSGPQAGGSGSTTNGADGAGDDVSPSPLPDTGPDDVCWFGVGDDGRWRIYVETTRDVGDLVALALDEARDTVIRRDGGDVTAIDGLRELAQRSLDSIESAARRDRHRINVHLHTDGTATDDLGVPLPDSIRRHLTCDGIVTPVLLERGVPVSVGRSERIVPERTRRMVLVRDGGCRVPGCDAVHHLDIHHIVHWSDDGTTDTWNLIALCPRHHRLHHQGRLSIVGNADQPDGVVFTGTDGRPIRPSGASPNPPTGPPPPIAGTFEHPLGERLNSAYVDFHPPPPGLRPQRSVS